MNKKKNIYNEQLHSDEFGTYEEPFSDEQVIKNDINKAPEPQKKEITFLEPDEVANFLSEDGSFASFFEKYEPRKPQLELSKKISQCFNDEAIGVFEAGTGVGKSLAYLLPSMMWATQNKSRIVISTGTINLQYQLMEKDVPTAKKILGKEFLDLKVLLVKGRNNFLCLRRLYQALEENDLFSDGIEELKKIKEWALETKKGSRSDMDFLPSDSVWSAVCSEADNCKSNRCPYFKKCFVMQMKKEAESSAILIVNHHILFADLSVRADGVGYTGTAVLPPYGNIVIDEAHSIENAAQSFFAGEASRFNLNKQIKLLHRSRRGKQIGILHNLASISSQAELYPQIIKHIEEAISSFNLLERKVLEILKNSSSKSLTQISSFQVNEILGEIKIFFKSIVSLNFKLQKIIDGADKTIDTGDAIYEAGVVLRRLKSIAILFENFLNWKDFETEVFWFEKMSLKSGEAIRFIQTPLDLSKIMRRSVFMPMSTVICLSATLKIGDSFNFWLIRNGLKFFTDKKIILDSFDSPFPYHKNVVFNIPTDISMPDQTNFQNDINQAVLSLIEMSEGKTLVLFTSYSSLKTTCDFVRENVMNGISILQQGEEDRMKLLNKFKNDLSSCLFATASFWAGVDVPGKALSHVILVKLPFSVPSDPIFKAKSELIEKKGGNSFMELSVPEAVIQFRQGFGRLMRSSEDRGIVTVLDKRILVKRYGGIFIQSVPETIQCFSSIQDILNKIENFLYN